MEKEMMLTSKNLVAYYAMNLCNGQTEYYMYDLDKQKYIEITEEEYQCLVAGD